jgi:hypothetical protein
MLSRGRTIAGSVEASCLLPLSGPNLHAANER